ncbi:MAG: carbohydrate ABC transporter permease [Hyphomicrobiales bacterium]|nr:MAG: carbohydrate ABC transporter permease [Hyphomicrobiales bacterium]
MAAVRGGRRHRPRHVLSGDLDGLLVVQIEPRDLPLALRFAGTVALGESHRGLAGRRARDALPQLGVRDTGRGQHVRAVRHGGRLRLYPAGVSGPQTQLRDMHLLNTPWALILPGAAWQLAFTVFLMRAYFISIRPDMEEAARLDGANTWEIFWHVSVPMVWPAMLTMVVLNTISVWNELLFALLFITDDAQRTLPVGLVRFSGYHSTDYSLVFAALTITTVPILILYFILQRHVIAGLTATAMD